jgi:CRP-like cAMP-binding protein
VPKKQTAPKPVRVTSTPNRILSSVPSEDAERLMSRAERLSLSFKEQLYDEGERIRDVFFVETGVVSMVIDLSEDQTIETGTVGNEGMAGIWAVLGADASPARVLCQIPGQALRLPARVVIEERERGGPLAVLLLRYANAVMAMLAQGAACNRAHPVEARMGRWLLMTHDRVGSPEFPLTQEFLAQMLGEQRPTVNLAGTTLQRAGLIKYSRGKISIEDRAGLEASACECYAFIRKQFDTALTNGAFPGPRQGARRQRSMTALRRVANASDR